MIGTEICGFKVESKAGEGAMGTVYCAWDPSLERRVALKVLKSVAREGSEERTRFLREARAAARLSHTNVATVLQVLEYNGQLVIVTEWIDGGTLEGLSFKPVDAWTKAAAILRDIAAGLDAAHAAGVIHRDLKGSNILIDHEGRAKICDFGVSRLVESTATGAALVGTPDRISPEQWQGQEATPQSDVFALGVLAYELLAGSKPFAGDTIAALCHEITSEPPSRISEANRALPMDADDVFARVLAKRPKDRFPSAGAFVANLCRVLEREPSPRSALWSLKAPSAKILGILVPASVAVGLTAFALTSANHSPERLAITHFEVAESVQPSVGFERRAVMGLAEVFSSDTSLLVVSMQRLQEILAQLRQGQPGSVMSELATEVARRADAKWLLHGWVEGTPPDVTVSAEWIDVSSSRVLLFSRIEATGSESFDATVRRLAEALRRQIVASRKSLAPVLPTP